MPTAYRSTFIPSAASRPTTAASPRAQPFSPVSSAMLPISSASLHRELLVVTADSSLGRLRDKPRRRSTGRPILSGPDRAGCLRNGPTATSCFASRTNLSTTRQQTLAAVTLTDAPPRTVPRPLSSSLPRTLPECLRSKPTGSNRLAPAYPNGLRATTIQ
jgi:hypothetical protein